MISALSEHEWQTGHSLKAQLNLQWQKEFKFSKKNIVFSIVHFDKVQKNGSFYLPVFMCLVFFQIDLKKKAGLGAGFQDMLILRRENVRKRQKC